MKGTPENIALLEKLGFECKPWEGYPETWWFDGQPIFTELKNVPDFPMLIRLCMITYTDVGGKWSDHKQDRTKIVQGLLNKVLSTI